MKRKQTKWFDSAIIKEDESKNTTNSKHFILNNGTRKAIFSPKTINYYDRSEDKWKPVDSTLKKSEAGYIAQIGNYTAKLSKTSMNETVEVSNGSSTIAWEYLGTNKNVFPQHMNGQISRSIKQKSKLKVKSAIHDALNLANTSRAIYTDAEGNIDLDYSIEGNGIKENITIRDKSTNYRYYFLLRISGFNMKSSSNGNTIEFYKTDSETEPASPDFIMPAPFMYDSNGVRSDAVQYVFEQMGDGNYIFSVEADPAWINAPERIFPIYIDPQLLDTSDSYITVTHKHYQWNETQDCETDCCNDCCDDNDNDCNKGSCSKSSWVYTDDYNFNYINVYNTGFEKTDILIHIKKSEIDLTGNTLISAKLIFEKYDDSNYSNHANIKIGDSNYTHYNANQLIVNITSLYSAHNGNFDVEMKMLDTGNSRQFTIPTLLIEYQPINYNSDVIKKSYGVENGVTAELDILSGNGTVVFDDISDPVLGVAVSHVYKPNDKIDEYGKNFRLNLDEKLKKTGSSNIGAQYTYTDSHGDKHTFKEHFYRIGLNGEKVYITTDVKSINVDADGRLWWNNVEVFRELTTDRGLTASSRLDGVNNAEWVEQRLDEEKQLEEQVKSYRNTLCNFVSVAKDTGTIDNTLNVNKLESPDAVESFINTIGCASHLLLSKEERVAYQSLLTQNQSLNTTKEALSVQLKSLKNNAKSLLLQHNSIDTFEYQKYSNEVQLKLLQYEKANYNILYDEEDDSKRKELYDDQKNLIGSTLHSLSDKTRRGLINYHQKTIIPAQETDWNSQKELIKYQINNFKEIGAPSATTDGTLTRQYANTEAQIAVVEKQLADVQAQIALYESKSSNYLSQLKSYYKEYLHLKNQLDTLKMQIPVSYLISDSAVHGFNANGDLVIVQDKYGKYVAVERETYSSSNATRISSVYDKDGRSMRFIYNENDKLSQICNSLGERTSFRYDESGYLVGIDREHLPSLTLSYSTVSSIERINKVESSNHTSATLAYNLTGMLTGITNSTTVSAISHDNVSTGSTTTLATLRVEYISDEVKITHDNAHQEIYKTNATTAQINAYYELINNKVTNAERYTYSDHLLTKTERADKSCLNRHAYADFAAKMAVETVENVTYNTFKAPMLAENFKYAMPRSDGDSPIEQTKTEYTYNDDRKLTEKKTTHTYYDDGEIADSTVTVEKYYYNPTGEIVRTESYIEGEELKTGVTIEEHVYNENGHEIQSFTYNSLDPSSKFYTENEVDETGRAIAAFDESGEHKTTFDYDRDGVSVKTERLPNGSKFSYGRAKDGAVTAITHSTEAGEENSTNQIRTLDVVTEIKSGNNTVGYTYDGKRRVKSVSLNGTNDYVKYTYSGEHTNAETVQATMANGSVAKSVKNYYGNVTKTTCGDRSVTNTYNEDQQLTKSVDSVSGTTTYSYDDKGNVTAVNAPDCTESYTYDAVENTLDSKKITIGNTTHTYTYAYKSTASKALDSISVDGKTVKPATDALGRNIGKSIEIGGNKIAEEKISYIKFGDHATSLPSTVRYATNGVINEGIQYKYDAMGNIIEVLANGRSVYRYEYDALGRLTREDNVSFGKTTTWSYDNNGNIIARYEYALTAKPTSELHLLNGTCISYAYDDNSDRLLSYNGEAFVYDSIGNPTTYRGKSAVWEYGRQLKSYNGNTFTYDARGRRTAKNGITFTYDSNGNLIKQSNGLEFFYDHTGVFAVKYNGSTYFYRKDAQANVTALLDNSGTVVVRYKYDAWGKCLTTVVDSSATEIANLNPFRYRSYYYDTETGFYFLKTRYYDPEIGRFMTIDDLAYLDPDSINGLNLYAYCLNNPVMMFDNSGCAPAWWQWLVSGLTLAAGIALCFVPGGQVFGVSLIVSGASGLISNTMDAFGVDGKIATLISSGLSIVAGIALCIPIGGIAAFAGIGAGLIGQGVLGIAGGYISEALGGSFELGAAIGGIVGSIAGGFAYRGVMSYKLSHMSAYEKGVYGETYVKALYGNKVYKPKTGSNRPDLLFENGSKLIEVKNVASQSMTRQLNRYLNMNIDKNIIYVRLGTKISSTLKNSAYTIKYFPW